MTHIRKPLEWLIVGGTPRSGTTALGAALNQSEEIALFHEYASHEFFVALDSFFREEDRMRGLGTTNDLLELLPTRAKNAENLARFIFQDTLGKKIPVIGTKFPGYQAWPQPDFPEWISPRYIHITRNPFDVVLSIIKKDYSSKEVSLQHVENALFQWIDSWNHAVDHVDDTNFLHIFYEDLLFDPEKEKHRAREFLHGIGDFSFSSFKAVHEKSTLDRYVEAGLEGYLPLIESVAPRIGWLDYARDMLDRRKRIGYPLRSGESINLSAQSNGWCRYTRGFYPAERDGSWTQGSVSEILFSPLFSSNGPIQVLFDVVWVATAHGESRELEIRLDGRKVFNGMIDLSGRNGQGRVYSIYVPQFECAPPQSVSLEFCIKQPVNPAMLGMSSDDRALGIMIRNVSFELLD